MANVNSCNGEVVRNPLTECPLDEDGVVREDDKKLISSDVEDLVGNYLEVSAAGARLLDDLGFPEMLSKMQQRIDAH